MSGALKNKANTPKGGKLVTKTTTPLVAPIKSSGLFPSDMTKEEIDAAARAVLTMPASQMLSNMNTSTALQNTASAGSESGEVESEEEYEEDEPESDDPYKGFGGGGDFPDQGGGGGGGGGDDPHHPDQGAGETDDEWESLVGSVTADEMESVFPTGLRTTEALVARQCAYCPAEPTKEGFIKVITDNRNNPEFQKGVGHKRAVMIFHIATMVHINHFSGLRAETPAMSIMRVESFPLETAIDYWKCFSKPRESTILWRKDGVNRVIRVPQRVADNRETVIWAQTPWSTI